MIHLALTTGEPAGIGPEISVKATRAFLKDNPDVTVHLLGDRQVLGCSDEPRLIVEQHATCDKVSPGELNVLNAPYVLSLLDSAVKGCQSGAYDAMVTAPIHKGIVNQSGIRFTGHTEYLAEKCGVPLVVMMLCGKPVFESSLLPEQLRVALATTHLPLHEVPKALTADLLEQTIHILHADLKNKFGIQKPLIYVTGLNPHAGESGHMGSEEVKVIEPVIQKMKSLGLQVEGPFAGDTIFSPKNLMAADAILAMYHDQGLAPFKFATFGSGVNVTLGLPIIRTSVDHGTALNMAGLGQADISSMLAALNLAKQLARNSSGTSST
jgi:4-hydroxythreonine-4-phosphate dehydrogenase